MQENLAERKTRDQSFGRRNGSAEAPLCQDGEKAREWQGDVEPKDAAGGHLKSKGPKGPREYPKLDVLTSVVTPRRYLM